jgi:hypothetical protein
MKSGGLVAFLLLLPACDPSGAGCRIDADCPGMACVNGMCKPLAGADFAGASDAGMGQADFSSGAPDGFTPDASPSCSLNGDGVLTRAEAPVMAGLGGLFAVNQSGSTVPVSMAKTNGKWDLSQPVANERKSFSQLMSPAGTWWAADFPTATYAERLDDGGALLGVYRITTDALELLGVVSEQDGLQKTRLTYVTPIPVLKFPLQMGSTWQAESDVSGLNQGIFYAGHDSYGFSVVERGPTVVPLGQFDTLRLRLDARVTSGFVVLTRITYLYMAECYGAVARIRSRDNESSGDFTQATEYRRLAAP